MGATGLEIETFGGLYIHQAEQPVEGFRTQKVKALAVYLALQTRPVSRDRLAEIFWVERSQEQSLSNLRVALTNLRRVLGDCVKTTRAAASLDLQAGVRLDVLEFERMLAAGALWDAVNCYRGDFLQGFSVPDSIEFDQWMDETREHYRQAVLGALRELVQRASAAGSLERAIAAANRLLALDPLDEAAHRQLMRLLAWNGQRSAALSQFETCCQVLERDMSLSPEAETVQLFHQIQSGTFAARGHGWQPGDLRPPETCNVDLDDLFVGRDAELERLWTAYRRAAGGQGQVLLVSGEAGSGKTMLVQAFLRQALLAESERQVGLVTVVSTCQPTGEPFQPFRDVLGKISGSQSTCRPLLSQGEHLADVFPVVVQALLEQGPDLIGTLVPGSILAELARTSTGDWRDRINGMMLRRAVRLQDQQAGDIPVIQQYIRVLMAAAESRSLVLVLEDLHWADSSSASLFCSLARQVSQSRILLIGTYREEDLQPGRDGQAGVLSRGLCEIQRQSGDVCIDLDQINQASKRPFIDRYLDAEPNALTESFRHLLTHLTEGQPLFVSELVRHLKANGSLIRDPAQRWVTGPAYGYTTLPAQVEAVVGLRIASASPEERMILRVAAIIGREFPAEVIARVLELEEFALIRTLSGRLSGEMRMVGELGLRFLGRQCLSTYYFRHTLFQKSLAAMIGPVEKAHLHRRVGQALEGLYLENGADLGEIASALADHFELAGLVEKSVDYRQQAGSRAALVGAYAEAAGCFRQALAQLATLPEDPDRDRQELSLQLALSASLHPLQGSGDAERRRAEARIQALCRRVGDHVHLLPALYSLRTSYKTLAERRVAREVAEKILASAGKVVYSQAGQGQAGSNGSNRAPADSQALMVAIAHWALGAELVLLGQLREARKHLEEAIRLYDSRANRWWAFLYGNDPGVASLARLAWVEWLLGYPDRALERSRAALELARELDHPLVLGFAMGIAGVMFHQLRGDVALVREWNLASRQLSRDNGLGLFANGEDILRGWVLAQEGRAEEELAQMRQGLSTRQAEERGWFYPHYLGLLGSAYGQAGQVEEGLAVLEEALRAVDESGEYYFQAELYRLSGELFRQAGQKEAAEARFLQGIEIARRQEAHAWNLRASTSLARLWVETGRFEEAANRLQECLDRYPSASDTTEILAAQKLLVEIRALISLPTGRPSL